LSAPSSPHFLSSTPLSPHFLRASISWIVRLRALSCHLLKNPRIFQITGQVTHYNVTTFEKSLYFSTGQVTHYNVTTFEKSSYFSTGQVTHYNVTILKNPRIFPLGRSPITMWPIWKILVCFKHRAGDLLQCDHFWKILVCFKHRAGDPLQCDHPEKSSYFSTGQVTHYNVTILKNPRIFPLGRSPITMWPIWKNPRMFQTSGRSPGTIRPLAKFFAFFYHRAGCPKQFDPSQKKKNKNKKNGPSSKWLVVSVKVMSIYCFWSFQDSQKSKSSFVSTFFFFINLPCKAKGK